MRMTRYCLCGAAMTVRAEPPALVLRLTEEFDGRHAGDGCGPTDAMTSWRARNRDERRRTERGHSTEDGAPRG